MRFILASASPRRAEVLRDAGIAFEALPTATDESHHPGETPNNFVCRLAESKARAAASRVAPGSAAIVIGADTEVVADGHVYGKPASAEDARRMLQQLAGRTHSVITALAAIRLPDGVQRTELEETRVTFAPLSGAEIEDYVASGEPFDKAGGYAIQGRGGRFVTRVEGCYFNVVGLPLARLDRILRDLGWPGG